MEESRDAPQPAISRPHIFFKRLLHLPLSSKLLLANSVMTAILACAGAIVAMWHVQASPLEVHYDLITLFVVAGFSISLIVNYRVMRLMLAPLDVLVTSIEGAWRGKAPILSVTTPSGDERFDRVLAGIVEMQNSLTMNVQLVLLLRQKVLYAQEEVRQQIARELHDEAAQSLTSVLLYLKLLEKSSKPDEAQRLQNLRKLTAHALSEIRRVAVDLHPRILDEWGLEAALGHRVDELNAAGDLRVDYELVGGLKGRLPKDLEWTFYRVAQEALSNVVRHSRARCAQVTLKREANWLTLEVQDNGVGFDKSVFAVKLSRGFGLLSMRERVRLVGGEFTLESQPGSGTNLSVRAPLPPVSLCEAAA
jgi:two-component system sensor histidine kinase UhpB